MFSLIVVIVSIALVAALAAATIYYGGDYAKSSNDKARAAKTFNEGTQIAGAAKVHNATVGVEAENIEELIAKEYLKTNPQGAWQTFQDAAVLLNVDEMACREINAKAGFSTTPECSDPNIVGKLVCCSE